MRIATILALMFLPCAAIAQQVSVPFTGTIELTIPQGPAGPPGPTGPAGASGSGASGSASLTDFGAVGDGVTDTAAAWQTAITAVCASTSSRTLRIPVGTFRFASPPAPVPCALNVRGEGPAVSHFVADFNQGWGFKIIGGQDQYGGGSIRDLHISVGVGRNPSFCGVVEAHLETDPNVISRNPHGFVIDNVYCGLQPGASPGAWSYGWYLDGSQNANPPAGVAPGIRFVQIRNSVVSGAINDAWLFYYAFGTRALVIDCFIPKGTAGVNAQTLNGAGTYVLSSTCTQL